MTAGAAANGQGLPRNDRDRNLVRNALGQVHDYLRRALRPGDTVVDATCGNGRDTVLCAGLVGPAGRVFAFDIQEQAIRNTRERLAEAGLLDRCTLVHDGHEHMDRYLPPSVRAVVFNLGWLPGGDHAIGTRADTTLAALSIALERLEPGGLIAMGLYYGGASGYEERDRVLEAVRLLDCRRFTVIRSELANAPHDPPIFIGIERTG